MCDRPWIVVAIYNPPSLLLYHSRPPRPPRPVRYAAWEESQNEFERARSVYERALDTDYRNVTIWLK